MNLLTSIERYLYWIPLTPILIVGLLSAAYWGLSAGQSLRAVAGAFLLKVSQRVLESTTIRRWAENGEKPLLLRSTSR